MNLELQNAIRLGMCCGWIKTLTRPIHMQELRRARSPQSRGDITIDNCSFVNCGTAVHIEGGSLSMTSSHIENCGTAIAASGNAFIDAEYMHINNCDTVFKEISGS